MPVLITDNFGEKLRCGSEDIYYIFTSYNISSERFAGVCYNLNGTIQTDPCTWIDEDMNNWRWEIYGKPKKAFHVCKLICKCNAREALQF